MLSRHAATLWQPHAGEKAGKSPSPSVISRRRTASRRKPSLQRGGPGTGLQRPTRCRQLRRTRRSPHSSFLLLLLAFAFSCEPFRSAITASVRRTHITCNERFESVYLHRGAWTENARTRPSNVRTTMIMALRSNGAENTSEMNIPLESKYWYFENNLF